jgi:hypothetical protein
MTKKEHLLKILPKIEYDLPLKDLNLILEAMEAHTDEQLILSGVSHRRELLIDFAQSMEAYAIHTSEIELKEGVAKYLKSINCG